MGPQGTECINITSNVIKSINYNLDLSELNVEHHELPNSTAIDLKKLPYF